MKKLYTLLLPVLFASTACTTSFNKTLTCTYEITGGKDIEMVMVYNQDGVTSYTLTGDKSNEANIKQGAQTQGTEQYAINMKAALESSGYTCSLVDSK
jgi:hypothetical protein